MPARTLFAFQCRSMLAIVMTIAGACVASPDDAAADRRWDNEGYILSAESVSGLKDEDIEWEQGRSIGASLYPVLSRGFASIVCQQGLRHLPQVMKLLDRQESFIVGHVVLTKLWRVPEKQKLYESEYIRNGVTTEYNGLKVRLHWVNTEQGVKKVVVIPDKEKQWKAIRQWWLDRYRDHPAEFSAKTFVVDD